MTIPDTSVPEGEWKTVPKVADWAGAAALCEDLLRTQSKDLRLAGWWAEAAAHMKGFGGLADGLQLAARLVAEQWEHVHPLPDDGDLGTRRGAIDWLLVRVQRLVRLVPVTVAVRGKRQSQGDIDTARARQAAPPASPEDAAKKLLMFDEIRRQQAGAGRTAFDATLREIEASLAAVAALQTAAEPRFGDDGPAFSEARKALEEALDLFKRYGRDCGFEAAAVAPTATATSAVGDDGVSVPAAGAAAGGPLATRAQALSQLREVAAFFRRTEPHSPVAYLADKAARWGDMPLHAWLRAVVKDESSLAHLEEALGIEPPPADPNRE